MANPQNFVAELFKRQPLGTALVVLGALSLVFVAVCFEASLSVGPLFGIGVVITFLSWVVGGPLALRAASRIQRSAGLKPTNELHSRGNNVLQSITGDDA